MTQTSWFTYPGTRIYKFGSSGAYGYIVDSLELDADGAPNAYHVGDIGLDSLANAGYPYQGWKDTLVSDPRTPSHPYVQQSGPTAGYFVSMTSLHNTDFPVTDPKRYVDATTIPYIVFPGSFYKKEGTGVYGSLGIVRNLNNGRQSGFVVADGGPEYEKLGEVSLRLASNLGGRDPNPRNGAGAPLGPFQFIVFPHAIEISPWPLSEANINQRAKASLDSIGGWPKISSN